MDKDSNTIITDIIDRFYMAWKENVTEYGKIYSDDSFLITQDGDFIKGDKIADFYHNTIFRDTEIKDNNVVYRCLSENGLYEIVDVGGTNEFAYSTLTHWVCIDNKPVREFELLAKKNECSVDQKGVDKQREYFCNIINKEHDVNKLLDSIYKKNPGYYTKGRFINSKKDLLSEYSYMSDEDFNIKLIKKFVYPVDSNYLYEIGEWQSGEYSGNYVLLWIRSDNIWKIAFDSN